MSLEGKVAVVTGSGRGLGLAYAQELARQGASVVINDVDVATADAAVKTITDAGGSAVAVVAPVGPTETAEQLVQTAVDTFGRLDILVTNAGVLRDTVLWKMSDDDFDTVIDVHLRGTFTCVRAAATYMRANEIAGRIVCIGSPTGQRGNFGQTNYAASKGGVIALTKALAKEVGSRGIRVNCVAPGYISTELTDVLPDEIRDVLLGQTPLGRLGEPEDIAGTVRFLLSDEAAFITGAVLSVDGGLGM